MTGATGGARPAGAVGDEGYKGYTGDAGPAGATGPAGPAGSSTPAPTRTPVAYGGKSDLSVSGPGSGGGVRGDASTDGTSLRLTPMDAVRSRQHHLQVSFSA